MILVYLTLLEIYSIIIDLREYIMLLVRLLILTKIAQHLHSIQLVVTSQELFAQELHLTSHLGLLLLKLATCTTYRFLTVKDASLQAKSLSRSLPQTVRLQLSTLTSQATPPRIFSSTPTIPFVLSRG